MLIGQLSDHPLPPLCVKKYGQSYQAIYLLLDFFVCYFIVSREKGEVAELLQVLSNKIDLENMAEEGNGTSTITPIKPRFIEHEQF